MTNVTKKIEKQEVQVSQNGLQSFDLSKPLPDLSKQSIAPFDLMADYWTPLNVGENKRVYFDKVANRNVLDQSSGEVIALECAYFIEVVNNEAKSVSNGSKRLVGAIQSNNIERGTALIITYLGKKANSTNAFKSDNWSVKPLIINL